MKYEGKPASILITLALAFAAMVVLAGCSLHPGESTQGQNSNLDARDIQGNGDSANKGPELTELERERLKEADSFYQKLADGLDVNILVVGDSISRGLGASRKDLRWVNMLAESLRETYGVEVTLTNKSLSGNTSYAGYVSLMALDDEIDYDLVIVCFAQNDDEYNFSLYYESILRAAKLRYPKASVLCILESCQKYYTSKIQVIKSLAAHYGLPVVDVITPFRGDYDMLTDDGIHPNDKGQEVYHDTVKSTIDDLVAERHGFDPAIAMRQEGGSDDAAKWENADDGQDWVEESANEDVAVDGDTPNSDGAESGVQPVNDDVTVFDSFQWLPVELFKREGNTFTLQTTTQGVVLGIDYYFIPGYNSSQVLVDGYTCASTEFWIDYDYIQHHIVVVNDWLYGNPVDVQNEIQVVFGEDAAGTQQADNFIGLAMSG